MDLCYVMTMFTSLKLQQYKQVCMKVFLSSFCESLCICAPVLLTLTLRVCDNCVFLAVCLH